MKRCPKCGLDRENTLFTKDKSRKDGLSTWCVECTRAKNSKRYNEDKDRRLVKQKEYHEDNRQENIVRMRARYSSMSDVYKAQAMAWAEANRDKVRQRAKRYYARRPEYFAEKARRKLIRIKEQTPIWANLDAIREFYRKARELTIATKVQHEVDHIVPLKGKNVRGLHWEGNLRIITRTENRMKSNKLEEELSHD